MIDFIIAASSHVTSISPGGLPQPKADSNTFQVILNIIYAIGGALALLMLTVSGFRYVISGGDPQRASKAKDGIIYSLVGLVILISSGAIVSFVVHRL